MLTLPNRAEKSLDMNQTGESAPSFFGYGSLVNLATHNCPNARTATAEGWARAWRHTGVREFAFLTAVPSPNTRIHGVIADVPRADWNALDEREHAYDRIKISGETAIYAIPDHSSRPATEDHPILLSYLDVVIQGYMQQFGKKGAEHFFETTQGWSAPILDDRHAPIYPRHQRLTDEERDVVDSTLKGLGVALRKA